MRSKYGFRGVLLVCVLIGRVGAAADAIPTIKIDDHGPDQRFPTDSSFYVQGDAGKDTTAVQVAIIRISSSAIYYSAPSCSAAAASIKADKPRDPMLDPGIYPVSSEFPDAVGDLSEQKVVLSSIWTPAAGGADPNFKVLISNDTKFIAAGVSYCLFVLKRMKQNDDKSIKQIFDDVGESLQDCQGTATGCDFFDTAMKKTRETLANKLPTAFNPDLCPLPPFAPGHILTPTETSAVKFCALIDHTIQAGNDAANMFVHRKAFEDNARGAPVLDLPRPWMSTDAGIGHAIAIALARHGPLVEAQVPNPALPDRCPPPRGATFEYHTLDHAVRVRAVQVMDDDLLLRVAGCDHHPSPVDGVTTNNLYVADGVTVYDLILLGHHQIATSEGKLSFSAVAELLDKLSFVAALTDTDLKRLEEITKKLEALKALTTAPRSPGPETLGKATAEVLSWLGSAATAYQQVLGAPLQAFKAWKKFDAEKADLAFSTGEIVKQDGPKAELRLGLTEQSWVFSYFAPLVGYAFIGSGGDDSASYTYTGFQFHLYANPVNDPLWSHGFSEDWKRALAFEVGFGLKNSNFGNESRYSGAWGLVPINLSVAFHIIPYTSISLGIGFVDRRETALASDNGRFTTRFIIGLNVVPNVIDLAKSYGTNPTVEKKP